MGQMLEWTMVSGWGWPSPSTLGTQSCSNRGLQRMGVHRAGGSPQPQHGRGSEGQPPTQLLPPPMLTTVGLVGL